MYAWLVMITCICWGLLFSLRGARSLPRLAAYSLSLTALLYSHPLGLLMAGTLAAGSLCVVRTFFGNLPRWLAAHLAPLILAAPWLGHYVDHSPEFLTGRLPIRFLIGTPIGFLGGNFLVLLGLLGAGWLRAPPPPAERDHRRVVRTTLSASLADPDAIAPLCLFLGWQPCFRARAVHPVRGARVPDPGCPGVGSPAVPGTPRRLLLF